MFSISSRIRKNAGLINSCLYDQNSFYDAFLADLEKAKRLVIIESPFITLRRTKLLLPALGELRGKGVQVIVNTKPLDEHELELRSQAQLAIEKLQTMGVLVLFTVGHHRKLVLLDQHIIWEGSLNVLSQKDSCELMRRIDSVPLSGQLLDHLRLEKYLA